MKALTVRAPWALMFFGREAGQPVKDIENRTFPTNFRGRVAIHCGQRMTLAEYDEAQAFMLKIGVTPPTLDECRAAAGKILGSVDLFDWKTYSDTSPWYIPGQFAWMVRDPRKLARPVSGAKGNLGFWEWDGEA